MIAIVFATIAALCATWSVVTSGRRNGGNPGQVLLLAFMVGFVFWLAVFVIVTALVPV